MKAFNHSLGESGVGFFGVPELARRYRRVFPGSLDSARMKVFGQHGAGIFAAPIVIADELRKVQRVHLIGRTEEIRQHFDAMSFGWITMRVPVSFANGRRATLSRPQ